jgi:hypothetical protein
MYGSTALGRFSEANRYDSLGGGSARRKADTYTHDKGNRPLARPRSRCVDNIKMDLRERGWDGVDWIEVAQDREKWGALVNTVMNLRVP